MNKKKQTDEAINDVLQREERNAQALAMLLTQQREKDGHLLALRLRMGRTPSYLATVPLSWVAQHVHFAGDLPIFQSKVNEGSKAVPIDAGTIDDIQQRQPDWRRQLPMAAYLATRQNRKFPPLLVVGYQGWVYNDKDEAWGDDNRALQDSINATPLEPKGVYYDLDVKDTNYYALDGQHRLMAILGLRDLLGNGRLTALNREGEPKKKSITREEVIGEISKKTHEPEGVIHERLQRVMNEDHIGIEIIPAVVIEETYGEARSRLRSTFVDVNENAKKPTKGESIILDENNGFRIVARRVMVANNLLKGDNVQQKQGQLSEKSSCYTTLEAVVEITKSYLEQKREFAGWNNPMLDDKDIGFVRPDENEIEKAADMVGKYFDALASLPSHTRFLQGKCAADIRGSGEDKDGNILEDNILFRPIAQMALASAVAKLERDHEKTLKPLINKLGAQEKKGQLQLHSEEAPWFGVLCEPIDGKMRRHKHYQQLCERLLVYLLGDGISSDDERNALRDDFANARSDVGGDRAIDLRGKPVPMSEVQLPHLW